MSILTEAQAKEKWCPLAREAWLEARASETLDSKIRVHPPAIESVVVGNRHNDSPRISRCIGSGCMAWRPVMRPGSDVEVGFCGAFGKPSGA
jgi:hypothetical protein